MTAHIFARSPWRRAFLGFAAALLTASQSPAFHLEDTLRGASVGHPVGGSFSADGWRVTERTDRVWYALPRLVSGSVEFTVTHLTMESLGTTADNEIFAMYEGGYGISEPIRYAPEFRENSYKCMLRIYNNAEAGRQGQQKLMWGLCPGGAPGYGSCACGASFFEEPFGGNGTWDGSAQRLRVEWGGGVTRYLRNGAVVLTIRWGDSGLTFGPSELHFSLGSSRPSAVADAQLPVGAVFSDLVFDGVEGAVATCPGAAVPDAGAPLDAGTSRVMEVPAIEDVTVDPGHATSVYPDARDLAVGAGDSEFYVKFRIDALPGRVVRAQLLLNSATDPSAAGSGASVFSAASASWSETSLTWGARPGPRGARLARVDGIAVNEPYVFDLGAGAITAPGVYAFAVLPETTDSNSAHFDAKEVSGARGPRLRLTIDPTMSLPDAGAPDVAMSDVGMSDVVAMSDVAASDVAASDVAASDVVASDAVVADASIARDASVVRDAVAVDALDAAPYDEVNPVVTGGCGCRTTPGSARGLWAIALLLGARRRRRYGALAGCQGS